MSNKEKNMLNSLFKTVKSRMSSEDVKPTKKKVKVPENFMFRCPRCQKAVFMEDFEQTDKVCPSCGYHTRLTCSERLLAIADKDSFIEYDVNMVSKDPLNFPGYKDKVAVLQKETGLKDAIVTGECTINGNRCVIGIMDSRFMMASMGSVVGEKITRAFERATESGLPVIMFTASGGARMHEGIISLMQMAKTSGAISLHNEAGNLYITVLTDPTTGGVTASFAMLGDIIIAEPKALVGFAGRRVIEDTIRQRLPDEFQSAEFLQEHGFVDMIVERKELRDTLAKLLDMHSSKASHNINIDIREGDDL